MLPEVSCDVCISFFIVSYYCCLLHVAPREFTVCCNTLQVAYAIYTVFTAVFCNILYLCLCALLQSLGMCVFIPSVSVHYRTTTVSPPCSCSPVCESSSCVLTLGTAPSDSLWDRLLELIRPLRETLYNTPSPPPSPSNRGAELVSHKLVKYVEPGRFFSFSLRGIGSSVSLLELYVCVTPRS